MAQQRRTTRVVLCLAVLLAFLAGWRWMAPTPYRSSPEPRGHEEALAELREGNARFVSCRRVLSVDTTHDGQRRHDTAKGQHPFAAVLCCSDSRVCPEFIFDQCPGSLFEIRNAGNVVDDDVMASAEYAVEHLHVPLIVVLGHKGCGAVKAVHDAEGKPLHAHLRALQEHMSGIRKHLGPRHSRPHDAAWLDWLARENARQQALELGRDSEPLGAAAGRGALKLVVGLYDMETGEVEFFGLEAQQAGS